MQPLLVIADINGGNNSALDRAHSIHLKTGAKIILLGFCYVSIGQAKDVSLAKLSRSQLEKKALQQRQQELKQLITKRKIKTSAITIKTQWSKDIAPAIVAFCNKSPVAMVIKSAHRSESFLYTSTDWLLLRKCAAPVMITANKSWKKKTRVVAAIDFATQSKSKIKLNHKIIQQAQSLASALGDSLHIAYALQIPQALADMDLIDGKQYAKEKRKSLKPTIATFCQQYAIDTANVHIKQGPAERVIPSTANALKADVLVVGTTGRKGLKGKLIGNTAEAILTHLQTDILAVKP